MSRIYTRNGEMRFPIAVGIAAVGLLFLVAMTPPGTAVNLIKKIPHAVYWLMGGASAIKG